MMRLLLRLECIAALTLLVTAAAAPAASDDTTRLGDLAAGETFAASGEWRSTSSSGERQWSVEGLHLAGNELRGRIESGIIGGANVEARLSGRGVTGKLLDDEGRTLLVFEGAVGADGASGTFRHVEGASGTWTWERPPKMEPTSLPENDDVRRQPSP